MSGRPAPQKGAGRIARKFAELRARREAALIPFIVAGDPNLEATRALVLELEARGVGAKALASVVQNRMVGAEQHDRELALAAHLGDHRENRGERGARGQPAR